MNQQRDDDALAGGDAPGDDSQALDTHCPRAGGACDPWPARAPAGHYWRRTDPLRAEEATREAARIGARALWVEPCYSTDGASGDEWFPVVLEGQAAHLTAFYQRQHPGWPGNNLVLRVGDRWCVRYSS
jgi:hypothetical protein